ncbi:hypothetical protein Q0Z83_021290 [Actinoplanes sichuanensis]|uniref:Pectinesterase family protein n=1 Tax=Actinoplanes sichuanensis TaxID=512349 RepID=A0ABW4AIR7_9ACTN|nr:pectinesterase family protein [Actinoplanes sichuanensis]BEL03938.1 hypothetical protein Q0Z83_021290 [Actinoplanes sichuanensis]
MPTTSPTTPAPTALPPAVAPTVAADGTGANVTTLGRPWAQSAHEVYRESNLSATIKPAQPWTDMGDATCKNARFFEYRNTGAGASVIGNRPQLTDAQAATYTPQKYLAGSDGWNPIA